MDLNIMMRKLNYINYRRKLKNTSSLEQKNERPFLVALLTSSCVRGVNANLLHLENFGCEASPSWLTLELLLKYKEQENDS
jgi:hypothetical protein